MRNAIPLYIDLRYVWKTDHVGQLWQARTNQCVAEEHLPKTGPLKDLKFAVVKHLHFAQVVLVAWAFVGAELKDSLAMLRRYRWDHQTRPPFKRDHERAFDADETGRGRRRVPKRRGGLHKLLVLGQLQLGGHQRLQCGRGDKQVEPGVSGPMSRLKAPMGEKPSRLSAGIRASAR